MSGRGKTISPKERDYIIGCYKSFTEPVSDRSPRMLKLLKLEAMRELYDEMQKHPIPKNDITRYLAHSGGRRGMEAADEILRLRFIVAELIETRVFRK